MARKPEELTTKARRTRAAIVAAARSLIGERGVSAVTIMAVCDAAGVGRTSFYNYFGDANALVETVALDAAMGIRTRFDQLHEDIPRGFYRLKKCLQMILLMGLEERETALLLTSLAQHSPSIPDFLRTEILKEFSGEDMITGSEGHKDVLADFLTLSTVALCRAVAEEKIARDQIDAHVEFLTASCRQEKL